jgi:formyl-CoA transferase/CoA:oxalate CoA-transferase
VGSSLIDQGTGLWAGLGILAALLERERTGAGAVVDVSLYETAVGYVAYHLAGFIADGTVPTGEGTVFPMVAPYQVYATRDGELMIAAGNDRLFLALSQALGLADLADDPRFRTNPDRVARREELNELLLTRLRTADTATWLERLATAGVPAAPVADIRDVAESPQTESLGLLQPLPDSRIAGLRLVPLPLSLDGERALHPSSPPAVGEHSAEILREAGYSDDEVAALRAAGVIRIG